MHQHFLRSGLFFYAICLYYKSPKFWFRMFLISQDIYTAKCNFLNFFLTVKLSTFIYLFTLFFKLYPIPMDMHNFKYIYIYTYTTIRKLISWRKRTCGNFSARREIRTAMYASWHYLMWNIHWVALKECSFFPRIDEYAYGTFYATLVL